MPWQRPSLTTLYDRIAKDFSGRLLDGGPVATRSVIAVFARVWAGAAHAMHGMLAWMFGQVFVDTAEAEYLERWAADWGMAKKAAAPAAGDITLSGQPGAVIPAATLWTDQGTALLYAQAADATISAEGSATARVVAQEPGAAGNLAAGAGLALVAPLAGVESNALVAEGGLTGGADEESDDALRGRLLERLRRPPRGGSCADYVRWAKEVPGVTRAWCYPLMLGIGTVGVCVVADDAPDGPLPSAELLARVAEHIEPLRPATVKEFEVFAPETLAVDVRLAIAPDSEALRDAVRGELADLFAREGEPGATLYRSHISEAVSLTPYEIDHTLYEPAANIAVPAGVLPRLGEVTFVASGDAGDAGGGA